MKECFEDICNCRCNSQDTTFDDIIKAETNFKISLYDICHSNIGWFTDTSICSEHYITEWDIDTNEGIYFYGTKTVIATNTICFT